MYWYSPNFIDSIVNYPPHNVSKNHNHFLESFFVVFHQNLLNLNLSFFTWYIIFNLLWRRRRPPQWSSDDDDDNVIDGDDRNDGDDRPICGPSSHSALHPAPAVTSLLSGINSPALPLNSRQHSSESEQSLTPYSYTLSRPNHTLSRPNQLESRQKAGTSTNSRRSLDSQSERSRNSTPARPLMETRPITG